MPMEGKMRKILNYALWFDIKRNMSEKIIGSLEFIFESLLSKYKICPDIEITFEDLFLKIDKSLYLVRVESSWSPGDISGIIKFKFLDEDEQVMAILISDDSYLPAHGLNNISKGQLYDFKEFSEQCNLIHKDSL